MTENIPSNFSPNVWKAERQTDSVTWTSPITDQNFDLLSDSLSQNMLCGWLIKYKKHSKHIEGRHGDVNISYHFCHSGSPSSRCRAGPSGGVNTWVTSGSERLNTLMSSRSWLNKVNVSLITGATHSNMLRTHLNPDSISNLFIFDLWGFSDQLHVYFTFTAYFFMSYLNK